MRLVRHTSGTKMNLTVEKKRKEKKRNKMKEALELAIELVSAMPVKYLSYIKGL